MYYLSVDYTVGFCYAIPVSFFFSNANTGSTIYYLYTTIKMTIYFFLFQYENDLPSHYGPSIGSMDSMYESHRLQNLHQSPPGMGHQSYPPYSTNSSMPVSSSQDSQLKRDKDSIYGYVNKKKRHVHPCIGIYYFLRYFVLIECYLYIYIDLYVLMDNFCWQFHKTSKCYL
jgi:hypothetical protein